MSDWQPIETAPKDGTPVLWFIDFRDGGPTHMTVGHWCNDVRGFNIKPVEGSSWHVMGAVAWMPLPEPPK